MRRSAARPRRRPHFGGLARPRGNRQVKCASEKKAREREESGRKETNERDKAGPPAFFVPGTGGNVHVRGVETGGPARFGRDSGARRSDGAQARALGRGGLRRRPDRKLRRGRGQRNPRRADGRLRPADQGGDARADRVLARGQAGHAPRGHPRHIDPLARVGAMPRMDRRAPRPGRPRAGDVDRRRRENPRRIGQPRLRGGPVPARHRQAHGPRVAFRRRRRQPRRRHPVHHGGPSRAAARKDGRGQNHSAGPAPARRGRRAAEHA